MYPFRILVQVVVEKSTVPVRTAEAVRRVLATNEGNVKFQVRRENCRKTGVHPPLETHVCASFCFIVNPYKLE